EILALGPRAVVIKRAEYGALLLTKDRIFWTPAYPLDEVRDPTGAGDAFAGGMLGHLARAGTFDDATLCRAVLHGTRCGAFAAAAQDGFAKAYFALSRFRTGAPFRPWLLRIVANEAKNRRKAAGRRATVDLSVAEDRPSGDTALSPEEAALASERRTFVLGAL